MTAATDGIHPLPHQIEQIAAITRTLAACDRTQLISACGTGKALTARWYAQSAGCLWVIVFVPSLALVAQILAEWRRVGDRSWPFAAQVICSDPGTAEGAAERAEDLGGDVPKLFWHQVSATITTQPSKAAAALAAAAKRTAPHVVFSTYHSAGVAAAACALTGTVFDLLVADEAHHLAGRPRDTFRLVLNRRAIPARKRLFMTATPAIVDGSGETLSMDDRHVFGPVAHTFSFAAAMQAGRLVDYRVVVIARRAGADPADRRTIGLIPSTLMAAAAEHQLRSVLTFHAFNADAAAFASAMDGRRLRHGRTVRARAVSGAQGGRKATVARAQALAWLGAVDSRECRLVASARCLSEGVDVPAVDGLMFAYPRRSVTGIIQAVGRSLRPAPGKTAATIIVPVTLPGDDDDTDLIASEFKHVWAVLRALRAHDERLADEIDAEIRHRVQRAATPRPGCHRLPGIGDRVRFDLPAGFDASRIQIRMVEATASGWERFHAAAVEYAELHGHAPAHWRVTHNGRDLGMWCQKQRQAHRDGLLPVWKTARLETIPGWAWDREDGAWRQDYATLRRLALSLPGGLHQAADQPSIYGPAGRGGSAGLKDRRNRPLGYWVALQRQRYRDDLLPQEYARLLEDLPGWDWSGGLPGDDVAMIQALRLFVEFEHHGNVPEPHVEECLPLGRWVWAVRRRKLTGRLHPALAEEIAACCPRYGNGRISFPWEHAETQWRLAYSALRAYVARTGSAARGPHDLVEQLPDTTVQVGQWVGLQRYKHRRGELEPRYTAWLEALPGWDWDPGRAAETFAEPVDLGTGLKHGRPGAYLGVRGRAPCKCETCIRARRAADRERGRARELERMNRLGGPRPALKAKIRIAELEVRGAGRTQIAAAADVPLGVIRKLAEGKTDLIARQHERSLAGHHPGHDQCDADPHRLPLPHRHREPGKDRRRPHPRPAEGPPRPRVRADVGGPRAELRHVGVPPVRRRADDHSPGRRRSRRPARPGREPDRAAGGPHPARAAAEGTAPRPAAGQLRGRGRCRHVIASAEKRHANHAQGGLIVQRTIRPDRPEPAETEREHGLYRCAGCGHGRYLMAWALAVVHGPLGDDGHLTEYDWDEEDWLFDDSIECARHPDGMLEKYVDGVWCRWWYCVPCAGTGYLRSIACQEESPLGRAHEGWRPADEVSDIDEPGWPRLGAGHVLDRSLRGYLPAHDTPKCRICGNFATSEVGRRPCAGDAHRCPAVIAGPEDSPEAVRPYKRDEWLCGRPGAMNENFTDWTCTSGHVTGLDHVSGSPPFRRHDGAHCLASCPWPFLDQYAGLNVARPPAAPRECQAPRL